MRVLKQVTEKVYASERHFIRWCDLGDRDYGYRIWEIAQDRTTKTDFRGPIDVVMHLLGYTHLQTDLKKD